MFGLCCFDDQQYVRAKCRIFVQLRIAETVSPSVLQSKQVRLLTAYATSELWISKKQVVGQQVGIITFEDRLESLPVEAIPCECGSETSLPEVGIHYP
jgi:hypothetical protein